MHICDPGTPEREAIEFSQEVHSETLFKINKQTNNNKPERAGGDIESGRRRVENGERRKRKWKKRERKGGRGRERGGKRGGRRLAVRSSQALRCTAYPLHGRHGLSKTMVLG